MARLSKVHYSPGDRGRSLCGRTGSKHGDGVYTICRVTFIRMAQQNDKAFPVCLNCLRVVEAQKEG